MSVKFTYYGGMCVLAERSDGKKILCDPYLSANPLTDCLPEKMYDVDYLLVSHNAFDHFGDTVEIMKNSNAVLFAGGEVVRRVQNALPDLEPSRTRITIYGDEQNFDGTVVRVMQAWHASNCVVNGMVIANPPLGFVVDVEPGVSYYHPGDTSLFSDMKLIREMYKPNVMAVGISSISEQYATEMNPREAAYAAQWIGADVVIPTHYAPGSLALQEFMKYAEFTSPKAVIRAEIGKPFVYTPFEVK